MPELRDPLSAAVRACQIPDSEKPPIPSWIVDIPGWTDHHPPGFVLGFHDRVNKPAVLARRDHDQACVNTQAVEHRRNETRLISAFASLFHHLDRGGTERSNNKISIVVSAI